MHVTSRLSESVAGHISSTYLLLEAYACMPELCKDVCGFPPLKSVCTKIVQHVRQYWHFWHTEVVYLNGQSHKSKARARRTLTACC